METVSQIDNNRKNIEKWFGNRFSKERKLTEYKGHVQGSHVEVCFSNIRTRKYKDIDELLIIALIPADDTFIGMTGSMQICQAPLSIIQ